MIYWLEWRSWVKHLVCKITGMWHYWRHKWFILFYFLNRIDYVILIEASSLKQIKKIKIKSTFYAYNNSSSNPWLIKKKIVRSYEITITKISSFIIFLVHLTRKFQNNIFSVLINCKSNRKLCFETFCSICKIVIKLIWIMKSKYIFIKYKSNGAPRSHSPSVCVLRSIISQFGRQHQERSSKNKKIKKLP